MMNTSCYHSELIDTNTNMVETNQHIEIIDTINGWVYDLKSFEFWKSRINRSLHEFVVDPSTLFDELSLTKIDYDKTYVYLRQCADGTTVLFKEKVDCKDPLHSLFSPALWKYYRTYKRIDDVKYKLFKDRQPSRETLKHFITSIDIVNREFKINKYGPPFQPSLPEAVKKEFQQKLEKQLNACTSVLNMYCVYDYNYIKSIYFLGNGSFHITIDADGMDDEIICIRDKTDKTENITTKWIHNGENSDYCRNYSGANIREAQWSVSCLMKLIAGTLVAYDIMNINLLKRIQFYDEGWMVDLYLNDGRMIKLCTQLDCSKDLFHLTSLYDSSIPTYYEDRDIDEYDYKVDQQ